MKLRIFIGLICFLISNTVCFSQVRGTQRGYQRDDDREWPTTNHEYYNASKGETFEDRGAYRESDNYNSPARVNSYGAEARRGEVSRGEGTSLGREDNYTARGVNSSDADREPPTDPEEPATIPVDSGVVFLIMAAFCLVFYTYYKSTRLNTESK